MAPAPDWRSRTARRVLVDTRSGRVGYAVDGPVGTVRLRPLAGGAEWQAPAADVRAATPEEVASSLPE